ncbi:MAG: hypothetical protein NVS1B11_37000 [Terriglobales bacterium]
MGKKRLEKPERKPKDSDRMTVNIKGVERRIWQAFKEQAREDRVQYGRLFEECAKAHLHLE